MKFLCVSCNTQMKLKQTQGRAAPDARGSLSLLFECPDCLMEVGMLTNPFETQLVTSLGVEIGGQTVAAAGTPAVATSTAGGPQAAGEAKTGKCPFSGMAREAMATAGVDASGETLPWTAQARVRLMNIPEFVRPMAKQGIERFAREGGFGEVNDKCLDAAKEKFGM